MTSHTVHAPAGAATAALGPARNAPFRLCRLAHALSASLSALAALATGPAHAAPVTWLAGATFWDLASSWSPGLPGAADDAILAGFDSTFRSGTVAIRSFVGTGRLTITGGTLSPSTASSIGALTHSGGTLSGAGAVAVMGNAIWSGGSMAGTGSTTFNGALDLTGSGNRSVSIRSLNLAGTTTWSNTSGSNGRIEANSGAVITNGGSFLDQNAFANALVNTGGAVSRFVNTGSYAKTGAGATVIDIAFDNSGSLDVQTGTLSLTRGGNHTGGSINVAGDATLRFGGGVHALTDIVVGSGSGQLQVSSGTVNSEGTLSAGGLLGVSGGTFNANGNTTVATFAQTGGAVGGTGSLGVSGPATWAAGSQSGSGSTTFNGALDLTGPGNRSVSIRSLNLAGTTTWSNTSGSNGRIEASSGAVITNSGSFVDQNAFDNALVNTGGAVPVFVNAGSYLKTGAADTTININVTNTGSIVVAAGNLRLTRALTNFSGSTLSGGSYAVTGPAALAFNGANIVSNAATIVLDGAGANLLNSNGGTDALASFATNTAAGSFSILNGRNFASAGNFSNAGNVSLGNGSSFTVGGSSFTNQAGATLTLAGGALAAPSVTNAGLVTGFGSVAGLGNTGSVVAGGGTLLASGGIQGATGGVRVDAGATLDLSPAEVGSSAASLSVAGNLVLGAQSFGVFGDYDNSAFGSGNGFDARANVTGTGQIIGVNAALTLEGDVVSPSPGLYTLDFGTVRGGSDVTRSFAIANTGTGASVRGAVQTAGAANISDLRLSGSAVVAGNFAPLSAGTQSTGFSATLQGGAAGGALVGQSLRVVSNYDNVGPLTVNLSGFSTTLATGSVAPAGPLDLGNFRVGGTPEGVGTVLAAANLATGAGAESLAVIAAGTSGNFAAVNNLGTGLVLPGDSAAAAVAIATSAAVAGVNSGSVTVQFGSNGQVFDAGFGTVATNSQTVDLSATGYRVAQAAGLPTSVSLSAQRVGGTLTQALSLSNAVPADGFSESLNAGISASGHAVATGTVVQLAPGASSNALSVGVDTSASGLRMGTATVALQSSGVGSSGLSDFDLPPQTIAVQGNVFQPAVPTLLTPGVDFGIVRVGDTVAPRSVTVSNNASGALTDTLVATLSGGTAPFAASGTASVVAGGSDTGSLSVQLATGNPGIYGSSAELGFVSRNPEMADLTLAGDTVTLSAQVNQIALPRLSQTGGSASFSGTAAGYVLDFGSVLQGSAAPTATLQLANAASAASPADALAGSFDLSAVLPGSGFMLDGFDNFAGLLAGQSLTGLAVDFGTDTLGSFSVLLLLNPVSTNGSGPDLGLAVVPLQLQGMVVEVPEPGGWALMAGGLLLLGLRLRRAG